MLYQGEKLYSCLPIYFNGQPSASSLAKAISELENAVGKLSQVQKMLLGTDGSVTNLLEIVTGQPVEIETLEQRTLPADEAVAAELVVRP